MTTTTFADLQLIEPLCRAVASEGYTAPTPIQAAAIPHVLTGGDLLGCAQTGTGKTAAFTLPLLHRLAESGRQPRKRCARALILTPTRELALQIADSIRQYGKYLQLRSAVVYGGVGHQPQIQKLNRGVDIVIATPGRLLDLMQQKHVRFDDLEIAVLDEADRMLDMGFIRDVRKIFQAIPAERQTLLFSATMPKEVAALADSFLVSPKRVEVARVSSTAEGIDDHVFFVKTEDKRALLLDVLRDKEIERVLIFARTKHRANRLAQQLSQKKIRAEAIHGNKSQNARQRALREFTSGKVRVLVATDIVARGIDVEGISHVINYELPNEAESYVHRIGRTARAGASGTAWSFCDREETSYLAGIEKLLKRAIPVAEAHEFHAEDIATFHRSAKEKRTNPRRRSNGRQQVASRRRRPWRGASSSRRAPARSHA
ncbi:MAG: DEAD/DEAH box helicase [Bdellovibrionales bacterium]|nr:DEAD/DEAH box helicase [Bdellovibrionales bacterium]